VIEQVAFLFDMDGTIADTMPFHLQAWMDLLGELGVRTSPQEFLRMTSGKMNHQILNEVLGMSLCDAELARFEARKESRFRELCRPHLRPIAGLADFLAESRRSNVAMAVATAAGKENRALVLEGLGLQRTSVSWSGPKTSGTGSQTPRFSSRLPAGFRSIHLAAWSLKTPFRESRPRTAPA